MAKRSVAGSAADPTIEFATLSIDDVEYKLAYSFNAIAEAESVTGCNLLRGLESLTDLSATQLRGLLYAAMTVAHPEFTIEQVGHLIRLDTIGPVTTALAEAYSLSMPKKKAENAEVETENDSN
jgi:hypothetical protein